DRRDVRNAGDLDAERVQSTDRRLTARTGALDTHFQGFDAIFQCNATGGFSSNLSSERRGFTRAFEACSTRRGPRQCIALAIGDRDDGVVEGRVDVCNAVGDALLDFFTNAL